MHSLTRHAQQACRLLLAAGALPALLVGCGGSKSAGTLAPGTGSAVIRINWPQRGRGREIPPGTDYIQVRVFTDSELTTLRTRINPPTTGTVATAQIGGLPVGPVLFVAEANSNSATATTPNPLASGGQTINVTASSPAQVAITLLPTSRTSADGLRADALGRAIVTVRDVPAAAAGVSLRVLLNGQVVPDIGEPATVPVSNLAAFGSVPFSIGPLAGGTYTFSASAVDANGTAIAMGSKTTDVAAGQESTIAVSLTAVAPSDGTPPSGGTTNNLGSAVLNISNIGTGDALLAVDPMPGDSSQHDPPPVLIQLRGAFVQNGLPISRIPVLVSGLAPGPWLFVVTTHTGLSTSDPVNHVGSITTEVKGGDQLALDVPLGNSQSAAPPSQDGTLSVDVTNMTGDTVQFLLVSAFDSTGRVRDQIVPYVTGVSERLVTFAVPGGPYTVVAATYGGAGFDRAAFDAALAASKTTIPPGAMAIGSTTATVQSGQTVQANIELRLQGTSGWGSVNLTMLQVPLNVERTIDPNTGLITKMTIVSSVVVKVFSMVDNQELPALTQVVVPPTWGPYDNSGNPIGGLLNPVGYDQVAPLRLRIDGVPVGQMRFEVTSMSGGGGSGSVLGRGSTITEIAALGADLTVTPVTVTVLPDGDLTTIPGLIIPGITNTAPDTQNPAPRSRAWSGQPIAQRLWLDWRNRRRR